MATNDCHRDGEDRDVKISPGTVLPENRNHYLDTGEACVKLEYPRGMVLQNTTGDLLFNVTTHTTKRTISIYVPYEFGVRTSRTYVWSSITNDYSCISISRLSDLDPVAPGWFRVTVSNGTSSIYPHSHLIRLFNVTAPGVVGRYFFKVFIDGRSIGAGNFPTLVVSADLNPAYISGTVLDCSSGFQRDRYGYVYEYSYAYGGPIQLEGSEGGKVVAEGIALDGRSVVGQAYFNASAEGRYTLYGLAPGVYNLTAYAAGYSPTSMPRLVQVCAGQSLDGVDLCVYASPKIEGIIWSKCGGRPIPWGAIATRTGPQFGAALVHVGVMGRDFIYATRGANTSDFLRYDTAADSWETMQPAPGPIGPGGSLAFDGDQYIYALQGVGSNSFYRYDVRNNNWTTINSNNPSVAEGGSLAYDGQYIYAVVGGNTGAFWRYDPGSNSWVRLAEAPGIVGAGGSLTFDGKSKFYVFQGGGENAFWIYDLLSDTWSQDPPADPMSPISAGGALTCDTQNRIIYALVGGGGTGFLSYSNLTDSWTTLANINPPSGVGPGGALTFDSHNGLIYALVGGGSASFYAYNTATGDWSSKADFPLSYPRPITVEILDLLDNSQRFLEGFTDPDSYNYFFIYDGSTELDGHIPQDGSGYVSGIWLQPYKIRIWVSEYLQLQDYIVPLSGKIAVARVEFDVHRTGRANVLVHFKDFAQGYPVQITPGRSLSIAFYDRDNILRGRNSTLVPSGSTSSSVIVTGFLGTRQDYGLPPGMYYVRVTVEGFYQPYDFYMTVSDCNSTSEASLEVVRTGSVTLTIRSVNCQSPPQPQNWRYGGSSIRVEFRDQYEALVYKIAFSRQTSSSSEATVFATDLRTGTYSIHIFTFGYYQKTPYLIEVIDGVTVDRVVDLTVGGTIELNLLLEKEDLPTRIDTYRFSESVPIRIEVYDGYDDFVAANVTHIPSSLTVSTFRLSGFRRYAGDPAWRWVNFYDTTDGVIQSDSGLAPGVYRLVVYLPGFLQESVAMTAALPECGSISITLVLSRLANLSGTVTSLNMFGVLVPLNWAIVDVIGQDTQDFTSTLDGSYEIWVKEGRYLVICSLNGYETSVKEVSLSEGSDVSLDFRLTPIGISIDEFKDFAYVPLAVTCVFCILLARRTAGRRFKPAG
ncbi:MAG: hypothetical protein QXO25_02200 [Candidatus Bathyarchaeia archaeon]